MDAIREALQLCRNTLWGLLVAHGKKEVQFPEYMRREIDNVEKWASEVLNQPDGDSLEARQEDEQ